MELLRRLLAFGCLLAALWIGPPADPGSFERRLGAGLLLAGVLAYFVLPRRPPVRQGLYYAGPRVAGLPDFLGVLLGGLFFALPLLITAGNDVGPFDSGWIILTILFWLLAALGLACPATAAWYATRGAEVGETHLVITGLFGRTPLTWESIGRVEPFSHPAVPSWMRGLLFLAGRNNPRLLGQALITGGTAEGLRLVCRDGRTFSFYWIGLVGAGPTLLQLKKRGIPVDPALLDRLGLNADDPLLSAPFPPPPGLLAFRLTGLILCAAAALLLKSQWNPRPPARIPDSLSVKPLTPGQRQELERLSAELRAVQAKMADIERRVKAATDPATRRALAAESDACIEDLLALQARLEALDHNP